VRVYEAYEVKNKRQKLRCLLLRRKKIYLFIYEVIIWEKRKKALLFRTRGWGILKTQGVGYFED
jgi:hypothetical protein